jgi:hypothetical protein
MLLLLQHLLSGTLGVGGGGERGRVRRARGWEINLKGNGDDLKWGRGRGKRRNV